MSVQQESQVMFFERNKANMDAERALLVPLKERVSDPELKRKCEMGLSYLDDWELFGFRFGPGWAPHFLERAMSYRKAVELAVSNWGYTAVSVPSTPKW
jgi:hypothetical protein